MERAKVERGATISVVPQTDPAGEWGSGFLELLPNVDVLICNQREAAAIAGVPFGGDRRPTWAQTDAAVRRLQRAGAPLVVVTLGPEGAIAVSFSRGGHDHMLMRDACMQLVVLYGEQHVPGLQARAIILLSICSLSRALPRTDL